MRDSRSRLSSHLLPGLLLTVFLLHCSAGANENEYAGPEVCARCHQAIADSQSKTAMAKTWRGSSSAALPIQFSETKKEGSGDSLYYEIRSAGDRVEFSVTGINHQRMAAPVRAMVGGTRHGVSFLLGVDRIGGLPLERSALLEGRYALSPVRSLVLSPGFDTDKPSNLEDGLGRVLSPTFEQRCLTCHGEPSTLGAGEHGGVRCESCHGPAARHAQSAMGRIQPFVRPPALKGANQLEACGQCHTGLSSATHSDPIPDEVLVSSQVSALRHSECFIQSGEAFACTACHNPHSDAPAVAQSSVSVCLQCHSTATSQHAAICPVNRTERCVECHMPKVESTSFRFTDHWIRVHPENGSRVRSEDISLRSQAIPKREFLRFIVVDSDEQASIAAQRLAKGEPFRTVAHDLSIDATAAVGGYAGEMELSDMDPKLAIAAAHLSYGEISTAIDVGQRRIILHRLPRDFKWQADLLYREASDLNSHGDRSGAMEKDKEALQFYPYFLRALVLMASLMGQQGNAQGASEILQTAVRLYPKDAGAQFNFALTLEGQPARQIEAFRRAIELDPDMIAAYESLGAALFSTGQASAAIDTFRRGLTIDPLSAALYYDLALALKQQGDETGAERARGLAAKLDPDIAARESSAR